jgi:adenosylcobinamide-phosphate synthase
MGLALPFLLAYLLDLFLGDPPGWPHPVRLLGSIIQYWETALYQTRVGAGALFWLAVMATTGVLILGVLGVAALLPPWGGVAVLAYFLYTGLATRSLHLESLKVETALVKGDLEGARASLSLIVGRETSHLSQEDIRRAVIETVAENLADGVVAPMFFTLLLGLPGLFFYKAANTMDSMVGYNNYWYAQFGKVAARADDVLNFIPARLTALLMIPTAMALGLDWRAAWRILRRDRGNAASVNAGCPEAAMAGALRVRLGGASVYFGRLVEKPFIGDPGQPLDQERYRQAIRLLYGTSLAMAAITLVGLLAARAGVWGVIPGLGSK